MVKHCKLLLMWPHILKRPFLFCPVCVSSHCYVGPNVQRQPFLLPFYKEYKAMHGWTIRDPDVWFNTARQNSGREKCSRTAGTGDSNACVVVLINNSRRTKMEGWEKWRKQSSISNLGLLLLPFISCRLWKLFFIINQIVECKRRLD